MHQAVRERLDAADDPVEAYYPETFNWSAACDRVRAVQPVLERLVCRPFKLDTGAQDASFFADLSIHRPGPKPGWIDTVFAVRFSNFGDLFTTWAYGPERLPEAVAAELVRAVEAVGFHFIPPAALEGAYTGRNPGFRSTTWWIRFFDYL